MKTLLTIAVFQLVEEQKQLQNGEGIEFIYANEGESEKDFAIRAFKEANGKYALLSLRNARIVDIKPLMNILDKNPADMICFTPSIIIRTTLLKSAANDCSDIFSCLSFAISECKSLLKTDYVPFMFDKIDTTFNEDNIQGLFLSITAFQKSKSTLTKGVYSQLLDRLCLRYAKFYLYAMLEISDGKMQADKLKYFDNKLKAELVLYVAFNNRFTYAKLDRLRNNSFKISFLTKFKFKKLI